MKYVDLSQKITTQMAVFPGDPGVSLEPMTSFEKDGCLVTELRFGSHTGTHLDAPLHFMPNGDPVDEIPLESLSGEAICVRARLYYSGGEEHPVIELDESERAKIARNDRVLIYTGWEREAETSAYFGSYPVFSKSVVDYLIKKRIRMLGVDLPTIVIKGEDISYMHTELLSRGIIPVEGLVNVSLIAGRRFFFSAVPLNIGGIDGSPVRAYAMFKR